MKIWRFYLKPNDLNEYIGFPNDKYSLYAFTNDKDLANLFINERNMNRFKVKKSKEEKEVYVDLANEHADFLLKERFLDSKDDDSEGKSPYIKKEVSVICTLYEEQTVDADFISTYAMTEEYWASMPYTKIFSDKLIKSLNVLEYDTMYKIFCPRLAPEETDYSGPSVGIDEFGNFIDIFKDLFK